MGRVGVEPTIPRISDAGLATWPPTHEMESRHSPQVRTVTASRTLTARWVFPVSGPPLANGTITVRDDTIEAIEPRGSRTADEDLGNFAIIPGLVNAHTHLDLSGARGLIPPTDPDHFTDWLRGVIAYRRSRTPEQVQEDIRAGLAECLRVGTTLIGDIAAEGGKLGGACGSTDAGRGVPRTDRAERRSEPRQRRMRLASSWDIQLDIRRLRLASQLGQPTRPVQRNEARYDVRHAPARNGA